MGSNAAIVIFLTEENFVSVVYSCFRLYSFSFFNSVHFFIFLQEARLIENYEQVIKDLENKLDLSHEKYRQLVEEHRQRYPIL